MCPEDNERTVIVNRISGVLKTLAGSCMPACGQRVRIVFQDVAEVPIGAWLWASGVGYLEITGFNPITQEIELLNLCPTNCAGQAAAGSPILACTLFAVQAPLCSATSGGTNSIFPYLNSGFTAPAVGNCIDVTVTNVNGLAVNKNVSLNNGIYRISAIKSATVITICNDGSGLVPGTVVNYQDAAGNLIVPVVLIDTNPCLNDPIFSGVPLSCDVGITARLFGTENNQVLVWNNITHRANFRTLGIPVLDCTELTVCLTLDPALPDGTPYLVTVADTSLFTVTEVVLIGGTTFTISSILSPTQMYVVPMSHPSAIQTYNVGSTLCSGDCCTLLDTRLTVVEHRVLDNTVDGCTAPNNLWLESSANFNDAVAIAPTNVVQGAPAVVGNEADLTFVNHSCHFTMGVHFTIDSLIEVATNGATDGQSADVIVGLNYAAGTAPAGPVGTVYQPNDTVVFKTVTGIPPGVNHKTWQQSFSGFFTVAPGASGEIKASASFAYQFGDIASFDVEELATRISYIAVAVH